MKTSMTRRQQPLEPGKSTPLCRGLASWSDPVQTCRPGGSSRALGGESRGGRPPVGRARQYQVPSGGDEEEEEGGYHSRARARAAGTRGGAGAEAGDRGGRAAGGAAGRRRRGAEDQDDQDEEAGMMNGRGSSQRAAGGGGGRGARGRAGARGGRGGEESEAEDGAEGAPKDKFMEAFFQARRAPPCPTRLPSSIRAPSIALQEVNEVKGVLENMRGCIDEVSALHDKAKTTTRPQAMKKLKDAMGEKVEEIAR